MFDFLEREGRRCSPRRSEPGSPTCSPARDCRWIRGGAWTRDARSPCFGPATAAAERTRFPAQVLTAELWRMALHTRIPSHSGLLRGTAHRLVPSMNLRASPSPSTRRGPGGRGPPGSRKEHLLHHEPALSYGAEPEALWMHAVVPVDGVQSAVVSRFKDMIFLPIETSGEGEINAYSRVQMALGEARAKAKAEFQDALSHSGTTLPGSRNSSPPSSSARSALSRAAPAWDCRDRREFRAPRRDIMADARVGERVIAAPLRPRVCVRLSALFSEQPSCAQGAHPVTHENGCEGVGRGCQTRPGASPPARSAFEDRRQSHGEVMARSGRPRHRDPAASLFSESLSCACRAPSA